MSLFTIYTNGLGHQVMQEPPPLGPDSYQDAPHHAPCGSRLRLPEASKAVFRSHGSDLLIFGEASADPIRTRGYAARRSADRCAAQAQGMSSSRREAGQRLTSFVSTSAK
jgi:hypothetical protein